MREVPYTLDVVNHAILGLLFEPDMKLGCERKADGKTPQPAIHVRLDTFITRKPADESEEKTQVARYNLHLVYTVPHKVFSRPGVGFDFRMGDLSTYRCISNHNSCWSGSVESYVNSAVMDALKAKLGAERYDREINDLQLVTLCDFQPLLVTVALDYSQEAMTSGASGIYRLALPSPDHT